MIELLLQAERAMSVGLVDRADVLYAQIAEADPQNSIAVVGLARVALERGDEPAALELARRALAIDPLNAAASRMVKRLEEVLRYREEGLMVQPETAPPPPSPAPASPSPASPSPTPASPIQAPVVLPAPVALHAPVPPPTVTPATIAAKPKWRSLLDRLFRRGQP